MILSAIHDLAGQILKKWCLRGQNLRSNKTYLKIKMGFCKFRFWLGQRVFFAGNIIQPELRSTWQIRNLEWIMRHALQVPLHDPYNVRFNRHKITNESCTWPCRRDTNWIWIMRCFLQVPSYNFALHHVQFQIGSMMLLAPCTQRQMGSRVFTASTMVQPGQHCTKGSIQTAPPMDPNTEIQCEKMD